MTHCLRVIFVAALLCATAIDAHPDAWPRGSGNAYVHLGLSQLDSSRAFAPDGDRVPYPGRGARQRSAVLYFETGLGEQWTVIGTVPWKSVLARGFENEFKTQGFSDLDLTLRRSFESRRGVLAIEVGSSFPLGYKSTDFPQLGTGEIDPHINLAWSQSLRVLPSAFVSLQSGYRRRGGPVKDELPYSLKAGFFPLRDVGTFVSLRGWESLASFAETDPTLGLVSGDSESFSAAGEVYFEVSRSFDANLEVSRVLRGRNTVSGTEIRIGMAFRIPRR